MLASVKMHELSITQSILDIAIEQAKTAKVDKITKINLVIGELSGFVIDCVQFYFDLLKKDSIAEEAVLTFELVPAQLKCRQCLNTFTPGETLWICPYCQSQQVEILAGRELCLESLEAE